MSWTTPEYSRTQVDTAGRLLAEGVKGLRLDNIDDYLAALDVISNWRSSHSFPLNTFQNGLRKRGKRIDGEAIPAQRIKRLASIRLKLRRYSGLRLSQLQDIGGARLVLADIDHVRRLVEDYRSSDLRHQLATADDYLAVPQTSGYRGVHLIYKYHSDKNPIYNGLRIELQIRSRLQHAWATAVETVGTFLRQSLKSSMGEQRWLRFFALMGTAIALTEDAPAVADTPKDEGALVAEIHEIATELDVINRLQVFQAALTALGDERPNGQYYLLTLDPVACSVVVQSFPKGSLDEAQSAYLAREKEVSESASDAVLVSVDSVDALQKAYPNYFLDTRVFIGLLEDVLHRRPVAASEPEDIPINPVESDWREQ